MLFTVFRVEPVPRRVLAARARAVYQASRACVIRNVRPRMGCAAFQENLMSGTSSPGPAPDALELAALLCSRVCHDLISPVGAIVNGLEVLDDNPKPEDREFALDLICKSAKTASARLQFCRLAFGAAGSSGAQIDLGDAQNMARGHIEDGKITISWNLPRLLLPKNRVKLLLNMLVIAQQTIPRGGTLTIDPVGEGETMSFRVTAAGLNARMPQNIADLLSASDRGVDAHAVQPYYTRLLAQACGLTVTLVPDGEKVVGQRRLKTSSRKADMVNAGLRTRPACFAKCPDEVGLSLTPASRPSAGEAAGKRCRRGGCQAPASRNSAPAGAASRPGGGYAVALGYREAVPARPPSCSAPTAAFEAPPRRRARDRHAGRQRARQAAWPDRRRRELARQFQRRVVRQQRDVDLALAQHGLRFVAARDARQPQPCRSHARPQIPI